MGLIIFGIYFYNNIDYYEKNFKNRLLKQTITTIDDTSTNILNSILKSTPDFIHSNMTNEKIRVKNEKSLSLLLNPDIESLYVLFSKKDKLYFLLDTAEVDRGMAGDIFIPEDENYFYEVKKEKVTKTFIQPESNLPGFTMVKPILKEKEIIGFMVVDYTKNRLLSLSSLLNINMKFFALTFLTILLMLFFIIYYIIHINYVKFKIYYNSKTNTYNRVYLIDHYEKINFKLYYIALVDIDFFKRINNLYGQENGDKVITAMIKKISSYLSSKDMLIQYSGEEFLLLIKKETASEDELKELLERIRLGIEKTNFFIGDDKFFLTISIGAFIKTDLEKSLQNSIHKADTALYKAKHNGRNRVVYFDLNQGQILYRERIKEMIEADKLVCFYQPIRSLEGGELHHYEALLRIVDGETIIFPDKILPAIENSYLYSTLTKKVIAFNVEKLRKDKKFKVAINLSADDLVNDAIIAILAQNADLSDRLYIEILENQSIDYIKVETSIQKLNLLGYKICIDDFGSGYSNINHLLNLSIDFLKIDGSIIKEIHQDKKAYSIVKTFALFCQENGIKIIAEFIDNEEVVQILKSFGVEYGQGFYFSKAKAYEELDKKHI